MDHQRNQKLQRPSIKICTYSGTTGNQEEATKSENSTNFFSSLKRTSCHQARNNKILIDLSQIKGPTGSIRGHKDVVRKSLEGITNSRRSDHLLLSTFISNSSSLVHQSSLQQTTRAVDDLYLERLFEDEQNQCVAYTTTLGVIRRTFEDSKLMKSILNLNLIKYEERDIYLNQEYKYQLRIRCKSIIVPALFVDGQHLGGVKELEAMNENGELHKLLSKFKMSKAPRGICLCCGNAKFIACQSCNGSRKSTIHHFKYNSIALRCIKCDKNEGLVQCPACSRFNQEDDDEDRLAANEVMSLNKATKSGQPGYVDANNNNILMEENEEEEISSC